MITTITVDMKIRVIHFRFLTVTSFNSDLGYSKQGFKFSKKMGFLLVIAIEVIRFKVSNQK